jgi:hypothetical protein
MDSQRRDSVSEVRMTKKRNLHMEEFKHGASMNVIWASDTAVPGTYVVLGQNSLKIMNPSGSVVRALK